MPPGYVRHTAKIEGDFVVFLIGARLVKPWLFWHMIPVGRAMSAMMAELEARPELGYLGQESWSGTTSIQVQYWRTREQLIEYARQREAAHLPAWRHFNKVIARTTAVGIWHETYCVRAGEYECVYGNMPAFGLGRVAERLVIGGATETAQGRLGLSTGDDAPDGV